MGLDIEYANHKVTRDFSHSKIIIRRMTRKWALTLDFRTLMRKEGDFATLLVADLSDQFLARGGAPWRDEA